jgi:hypothetical protein
VFIGSIPSVILGRPRWTDNAEHIDFFVKREDARCALDALEEAGFATQKVRLAPPEDLLVMKVIAHGQDRQTYGTTRWDPGQRRS